MDKEIIPLFYKNQILYFHLSQKYKWFIDENSLLNLFQIDKSKLDLIREKLENNRHFFVEKIQDIALQKDSESIFWSKKGIIKIAYLLNSEIAFDVVDNLEDIQLEKKELIFDELEKVFKNRLSQIDKNGSFEDIAKFIESFSKFIKEKNSISAKKDMGLKSIFLDMFAETLKTGVKN